MCIRDRFHTTPFLYKKNIRILNFFQKMDGIKSIMIVWPTIEGIMVDARDQVTIISLSSPILIFSNVSDKCLATNLFFTTIFFDNSFFFHLKRYIFFLSLIHI